MPFGLFPSSLLIVFLSFVYLVLWLLCAVGNFFYAQFGFSFLILLQLLCLKQFSFHSTVCVLIYFIKGFIHILFKVLEHIHNRYFEVLVLYFIHIAFLMVHCSGAARV